MPLALTRLLYQLLMPLALLFMLPAAWRKMKARGGKTSDLASRLGFFSVDQKAQVAALPCGKNRWWLHAVSVGEVGIAMKLIKRLLSREPQRGVVITTTTPTGHAMAREFAATYPGRVGVLYSPIDLWGVGEAFLDLIQPSQLLLVEAELWPNLVTEAKKQGIRVSMVNARLSARSEQRFRTFRFFVQPLFALLDEVHVQESQDAERFHGIGVGLEKTVHTGSIKFDPAGAEPDAQQVAELRQILLNQGLLPQRQLILLASTHRGEEVALGLKVKEVVQQINNACFGLLIVPRHVERAAELLAELKEAGLPARTRLPLGQEEPMEYDESLPVLLINSTGELKAWQALADLVIVGKSFLAHGGQNPAEAVMAKKPVLFGPYMENFEALVDLLLKHQGALQLPSLEALPAALLSLLREPQKGRQLAEVGFTALHVHEGATDRTLNLLLVERLS